MQTRRSLRAIASASTPRLRLPAHSNSRRGCGSSLSAAAAVKLPTAHDEMGLGTGETDYGAFLAFHQRLLGVKLSVSGGYIVTGDPSVFDYEDVPLLGIGVAKAFGMTNVYASLEGRGATIAEADDPLEASLGAFHILSRDYALTAGATFGRQVVKVPARRIGDAVVRLLELYQKEKQDGESALAFFRRIEPAAVKLAVADLAAFDPATARPEEYLDLGDEAPFVVAIGQGECAV